MNSKSFFAIGSEQFCELVRSQGWGGFSSCGLAGVVCHFDGRYECVIIDGNLNGFFAVVEEIREDLSYEGLVIVVGVAEPHEDNLEQYGCVFCSGVVDIPEIIEQRFPETAGDIPLNQIEIC